MLASFTVTQYPCMHIVRGRVALMVPINDDESFRSITLLITYPQPPHYRSVGTGMGDRLRAGIPSRYVYSHPGQLTLLPSVGRKISIGQSVMMMRCGWDQMEDGSFNLWISVWEAGKTV